MTLSVEYALESYRGRAGGIVGVDAKECRVILHIDVTGKLKVHSGECLTFYGSSQRHGHKVILALYDKRRFDCTVAFEGYGSDVDIMVGLRGTVDYIKGVDTELLADNNHTVLDGSIIAVIVEASLLEEFELCIAERCNGSVVRQFLEIIGGNHIYGRGTVHSSLRIGSSLDTRICSLSKVPYVGRESLGTGSRSKITCQGSETCGVEIGHLTVVIYIFKHRIATVDNLADYLIAVLAVVLICLTFYSSGSVTVAHLRRNLVGAELNLADDTACDTRIAVNESGRVAVDQFAGEQTSDTTYTRFIAVADHHACRERTAQSTHLYHTGNTAEILLTVGIFISYQTAECEILAIACNQVADNATAGIARAGHEHLCACGRTVAHAAVHLTGYTADITAAFDDSTLDMAVAD